MKFAIVNNEKVEAAKGLKGFCPICQEPVISKCGSIKVNHWAHKRCSHCDKWWENETEWHRNWKNHFPEEWQEFVAFDEKTGEKHIADIKTNNDMVIEFQHSHISEEERISRENFYKNMIWVVDGTRRKRDYEKFCSLIGYGDLWNVPNTRLYVVKYGIGNFPHEWRNSKVPVFYDFLGLLNPNDYCNNDQRRYPLWCLLPIRETKKSLSIIFYIDRDLFIQDVIKGRFSLNYKEITNIIDDNIINNRLQRVRIRQH